LHPINTNLLQMPRLDNTYGPELLRFGESR
jgi:hypothetical protein